MMKFKVELEDEVLSDLLGAHEPVIFEYEKEKIWNPNGISLTKRLKGKPSFKPKVDKVLKPSNLKKYIVLADSTAPTRCIDGRMIKNWSENKQLQQRPLGAKVAGGTPHAAL